MYGIDVSTYQSTLDMGAVRAAGNEFVGIKAVASYRPNLLVAENYHNNTDRVMAAGLPKYPYAVPNTQNSPEATAQFCIENWYRRSPNDGYMLDNEPLDAYGVFWGDDEVFRYWTEMRTLGFDLRRGIEYCPAALTRSRGRWSKLIQLREEWGLKIQWVSYGDNDPYYEDGEQPFTGTTGLDNPEMHQFTSSYTIPGYGGLIDRVHSRLAVQQLFGGPMPRTPAGVFAWARHEAANGNILSDWAGWCEKFINNAGAFNQGFGSALLAGNASGTLRTDYANAPVGAIVYWGGVNGLGHDAFVYERGADPLLLMVTSASELDDWGHNIGTIRLSAYQRAFGWPLRGWTLRHGTETLDFSGTAGLGTSPVEEEEDMKLNHIWNYDGGIGIIDDGGLLNTCANVGEYDCLARLGLVPSRGSAEWNASRQPDGTVWNGLTSFTARNRAAQVGLDVDEAALAAKLAPEIAPLVVSPIVAAIGEIDGVSLTEEQVAQVVDSTLRNVLGSLG